MLQRPYYMSRLLTATGRSPVTALLGTAPVRQDNALRREFAQHHQATFFDLGLFLISVVCRIQSFVLGPNLTVWVVLDEIQARSDLLPGYCASWWTDF